jgi:uncharacterized repeat protein (TIGR01451 family)
MFIRRFSILTLSAAILTAGVSAHALTATQKVEKEITVQQADGTNVTQLVSAAEVTPGEKIVYTVDYTNDSAEAATDIVLAMPVPADVRFLEGSADKDGAVVRYSADGGASFVERDALVLPAVGGGTRAANADDITHIQWRIAGPVPVGTSDKIMFKARLR